MPRRTSTPTPAPQAEAQAPVTETPAPAESPTVLTGRLCADPQLRHTATSGKPVTSLRLAVNDGSEPTFHSVVVWGRQAEVVCQYLKKGRLVEVTGRSQERTFQAEDGSERRSVELVAYRVQFLASRAPAEPQVEKALS